MYRVSGKQLVALVLFSALLAAALAASAQRFLADRTARAEPTPSAEPTATSDPAAGTDEQNNIDIYRSVSPGVVNITNTSYARTWYGGVYPQEGSGSGSIIDDRGDILTNYHVVENASQLEVQIGDDKYPGKVVGTDRDHDLAVIKVDVARDHLTVVKRGTSRGLQVGQKVLAIGNPFGLQRTLTTGIISGLERPIRDQSARRTIEGAIQTDASINPGNSGGPLLNSRGEMIGINTMIYSQSGGSVGIGFAVPVDTANRIIPEIISKGYVSRPSIGVINPVALTPDLVRRLGLTVEHGLLVTYVSRGSGAASAGIRPAILREDIWGNATLQQLGDIILAVDGHSIATLEDLQRTLDDKRPGQTVEVELLRERNRATLRVRLDERARDER